VDNVSPYLHRDDFRQKNKIRLMVWRQVLLTIDTEIGLNLGARSVLRVNDASLPTLSDIFLTSEELAQHLPPPDIFRVLKDSGIETA
jgi:hypothetical protein